MSKKIAILGLGYIGLNTFIAISKVKTFNVVGYDTDKNRISSIKKGKSYILDKEISTFIKNKKPNVSSDKKIINNSNIFIICVPTPVHDDYNPDYSYIKNAAEIISKSIKKGSHVVLESTVNPGTCREIIVPILEKNFGLKAGEDFNLAHCPERANPADEKWNIYNIPRNIGSINKKFNKEIANFYRTFINAKIHEVNSLEIAEATKIIENTFRDINIAYVNELAKSFDAMGIDLHETIKASSSKPFAFMAHWPGCGVGGHCIAVDPYYLIKSAEKKGFNHKFLKLAREINNSMPDYLIERLMLGLDELGMSVKKTKITLLGITYKPEINDTRESPSLIIRNKLLKLGADLKVYDPYIKSDFSSLRQAIKESACIIVTTAHKDFVENLPKLLLKSKVKLLIDGRNCIDKKFLQKNNIIYKGIGR